MNSAPCSNASTGLCTTTFGMPGIAPVMMSSRLGLVADVMPTESPSQLSPVVIQITCAVICSVSCCLGANSTGICSLLSTDPRQRVADQLVHDPPAAEARLHQHHPRRLGAHLADLGRPLAAGRPRASRPGPRPPSPGATKATSLPSLATYIGSIPRISAAPATTGSTGTWPSRTIIATRWTRASSLSTEATPPRVASRMQRRPCPAASSSASATGHRLAGVGLHLGLELELPAREHDRRAVLADRAGEQHAVAGPQALRRRAARAGRARRRRWSRGTSRRRDRARRPWCRPRRPRRRPRARRRDRLDLGAQDVGCPGPPRGSSRP